MIVVDRKKEIQTTPSLSGKFSQEASLTLLSSDEHISTYEVKQSKPFVNEKLSVVWKLENIGVKGSWNAISILDKRFRTDWEVPQTESTISCGIPILSLYDHLDNNVITVACSDTIHNIQIEIALREEDNHFYCALHFFQNEIITEDYAAKIYVNTTKRQFSTVIPKASDWIVIANEIKTSVVPPAAKVPVYSTWYSFHQNMSEDLLLEECKAVKKLGYDLIIIDDGWQTNDDNRGYDFTGDWESVRFQNLRKLVDSIHELGMQVMLWYSVPFCGFKSKAYQKFQGKFLTEKHPWAPVFDPRFPEVRDYLVTNYVNALKDWNLDGFKLDFIDDFRIYPETEIENLNGRDTLSVAKGTSLLIQQINKELSNAKKDILVEFRQKYISPSLAILGNMFRAFDCPSDSLVNRVRIVDLKLISGKAAVHSDMLTWHKDEPVEIAALQLTSVLFSVPQLSVKIVERSDDEIKMIKFYTNYWIQNKHVLLDGDFIASKPLANYPYLTSFSDKLIIIGVYDDVVIPLETQSPEIHLINGKLSDHIIIKSSLDHKNWNATSINCKGETASQSKIQITNSILELECPPNGMIILTQSDIMN